MWLGFKFPRYHGPMLDAYSQPLLRSHDIVHLFNLADAKIISRLTVPVLDVSALLIKKR